MRALLLTLALLTPAAHSQSIAEQSLLQLANESRAQYGIAPLTLDPALTRAARLHVNLAARAGGTAQHQYPGEPDLLTRAAQAGVHFSTISENVAGNARTAPEIHDSWMHSPSHRTNLLDPRLTSIGIAVAAVRSRGQGQPVLYAVEDFSRSVPNLTTGDVERRAQQLLLNRGIQPAPDPQAKADARQACLSGAATLTHPTLILQWEGPDINDLPATVLPHIKTRNQTVAIGTCPTTRPSQGFTTYRIAVLIYQDSGF